MKLFYINKGQAIVEFVISITLILLLFSGVFYFGRFFLIRINMQTLSQYALLMRKSSYSRKDTIKEIRRKIKSDISINNKYLPAVLPSNSEEVILKYKLYTPVLLKKIIPTILIKERYVTTINTWYYGFPN